MKKILLVDNGQEFNLDTPYINPLGGSETSLLLLAKGLVYLNQNIVILGNSKNTPIKENNIILDNISNFNRYAEISDVIILNRFIPSSIFEFKNKILYYYSHDAYDQLNVQWLYDKELVNIFSKVLCVSEWQKNTFIKYFNIERANFAVLPNSLDSSLYYGYTKRNNNKLIFISIPYKGIEILSDIFNDLIIKTKNNNLELHIYSSMKLYGREEEDKDYSIYFNKLSKIKNVYLHDPVSMKDLSYELKSSSLILFPNTYHETFSMACTQAQASGCIPISTNIGAMEERIINNKTGFLTTGKNIFNYDTYDEYVNLVSNVLSKDLYKIRLAAEEDAKQYDNIKIASKFLDILEGDISSFKKE